MMHLINRQIPYEHRAEHSENERFMTALTSDFTEEPLIILSWDITQP